MIARCVYCQNEFEAARERAKFCSDKCRATFYQNVKGADGGAITIRIYKLLHPVSKLPFYVGRTVGSLNQRLNVHLSDTENKRKQVIFKEIREAGLRPIIEEIESHLVKTDEEELLALRREEYWIKRLQAEGNDLTNGSYADVRFLIDYRKRSYKTDRFSVRFRKDLYEKMMQKEGIDSPQRVLDAYEKIIELSFCPELTAPTLARHTPQVEEKREIKSTNVQKKEIEAGLPDIDLNKDTKLKNLKMAVNEQDGKPVPPAGLTGLDLSLWKRENWK